MEGREPNLNELAKPIPEGHVVGLVISRLKGRDNNTSGLLSNLHCVKVAMEDQERRPQSKMSVEEMEEMEGAFLLILKSRMPTSESGLAKVRAHR